MFSIPPAITTDASPSATILAAMMTVCRLEPQTLLTVTAPTPCGRPAPMAACLAGACPSPALSTQPISTLSMRSPGRPVLAQASRIARLPNRVAGMELKAPVKLPIGVLAALTMTAWGLSLITASPSRSAPNSPSPCS